MSRRMRRLAVGLWAVLVVAGGGLTLLLQDSVEPSGAYHVEYGPATPSPTVLPSGCPTPAPEAAEGSGAEYVAIACAVRR